MSQHLIRGADLLKGVNATGGQGKVDGSATDKVPCARISPALEELDFVSAPSEVCRKQTSRESATD
jgi:hypothetical protein